MSKTTPLDPNTAAKLAADPQTDPATLFEIAKTYPQLHSTIARNPQAYDDLLKWMASLGVVEATEALRYRHRKAKAGAATAVPVVSAAPPKKSTNRGLIALLVFLVVVLLTLIGLVIAALSGWGVLSPVKPTNQSVEITDEDEATKKAAENAEEEKERREKEQAQQEEKEKDTTQDRYPVPEGTPEITPVRAPSGNIFCELNEDRIRCTIHENYFVEKGLPNCGEGKPVTFEVSENSTTMTCSPLSKSGTELPYDHYTTRGDTACRVTTAGMNCWNKKTGQSVFLARDIWTDGSTGPR